MGSEEVKQGKRVGVGLNMPRTLSLSAFAPSKSPEKIIFLDVDGVLHPISGRGGLLRKDCLHRLKRIVTETRCEIVISSNWRKSKKLLTNLRKCFKVHGLRWIDTTPVLAEGTVSARTRRDEIKSWIKRNEYEGSWIVLDDLNLADIANVEDKGRCIRTKAWVGLDANAEAVAISVLGRNKRSGSAELQEKAAQVPIYKVFNPCVPVSN
ncbi:hypothetical protein NDN08_000863 [Rhodosorus marinus]|uniref:FCP1 homology domain-containing protein n=1 Tax=Rhodosorus marinus TaxID=101924 RepID=A0AAV8UTC4_9RHOD|nr:hypothetical protein NDN08_000863 [Rhodosorus marinus]